MQNMTRLDPIGLLWTNAWNLFKERFETFIKILVAPLLLVLVGAIIPSDTFAGVFFHVLFVCAGAVIYVFAAIALIYVVQHNVAAGEAYKKSTGFFWPFIWVSILSFFAVLGGFFMLIVPGIMLAISFTFARYLVVFENRRGIEALAVSRDYVKGYWWAILGRVILLGLGIGAVSIILQLIATPFHNVILHAIISAVLATVVSPFAIAYQYVIYKNLAALKPHLAIEKPAQRGFIIASAIVGLVAPIILATLIILAIGVAVVHFWKSGPATSGTPLPLIALPPSAAIGDTVKLYGFGFGATDTIELDGLTAASLRNLPSDGKSITFTIPESVGPNCPPGLLCAQFLKSIMPGAHEITVLTNGTTSMAVPFIIATSSVK